MKAVKMNVVISQFQSNFERVFCVWFDTSVFGVLPWREVLKVAIYRLLKRYTERKVTKKAEQGKGRNTLLTFFFSMQ